MKTKEELNAIKEETMVVSQKLAELTEDELEEVIGGLHNMPKINPDEKYVLKTGENVNSIIPIIFAGMNGNLSSLDNIKEKDDGGASQE